MFDLSTSLVPVGEVSPLVDRAAWLERKQHSIGASDTPKVMGLSGSRVKLYLEKVGLLEPEPMTEEQKWGLRLEPLIAAAYEERTGRRIVKSQIFAEHPEYPWLSATIDCLTEDGDIVELKAVGGFGMGRQLGDDEDNETLPDSWCIQSQQQMMIHDRPVAFFGVFGSGLRLRTYTLKRHDALNGIIIGDVGRFWHNHIVPRIMPQDYEAKDAATLAKAYRRDSGEWLTLGHEHATAAMKYHEIKAEIKRLEDLRDVEKARMLGALGDAAGADLPGGWSLSRRVIEVNYKSRAAHTDSQVRFSVKEPRGC